MKGMSITGSKKLLGFCCILAALVFLAAGQPVYAAPSQAEIITKSSQGDLTVMFTFDKEVVDITFISPSGERKTSSDSDVEYSSGELWSTYRISGAQAGTWSAEYELGSNSEIQYSVIEDNYGLWIQYLDVEQPSGDRMGLSFEADLEDSSIYYDYEIYALNTADSDAASKIAQGSAAAGVEASVQADLSGLSSGTYVFRLDVYCQDGTAELFDSVQSGEISYTNPNEGSAIENFAVEVDSGSRMCTVSWDDYKGAGDDGYKLIASADGESIYTAELERSISEDSFLFPAGAGNLEIKLAYKRDQIWSSYKTKSIDLEAETLNLGEDEITASSQLELSYKVSKERLLHVSVNGEEGSYQVEGEGMLAFDLAAGSNTVYAEMELDDLVRCVIDAEVYHDTTPPSITLYDDLDGKTFFSDSVTILGKISGAGTLWISGEEITLEEDGSFSYEAKLSLGENVVEIEAKDANGNAASRVLTLYKGSGVWNQASPAKGWVQFLPLLAAVLTSLLIIVASWAFMKKTEKKQKHRKKTGAAFFVWDIFVCLAEGICVWQFIERYRFLHSAAYLELAEKSASEAVAYLRLERFFETASWVGALLLILSAVITVLVFRRRRRKALKNPDTQKQD